MSGSSSKEQALDARQLAAAVNLFLKHSTPAFTVDICCDAFIKTLAHFIEGRVFFGYCWQPDRQLHERSPIYFSYYGKPILWFVVGLANARALTNTEAQEFLLLFCRCCMVSLHGAFVAKVERLEKADNLPPAEQFNLALQWFHSVIRHLNLGISRLQSGQPAAAADA